MEDTTFPISLEFPFLAGLDLPAVLPGIKQIFSFSDDQWLQKFYSLSMDSRFPTTIATVYALAVIWFNQVNRKHRHKPWFSNNNPAFNSTVIIHNLILLSFSSWVFSSTFLWIQRAWNEVNGKHFPAYFVNLLCKADDIQNFEGTTLWKKKWGYLYNDSVQQDLEHLWFLAWVFYLSKVYEVVDTVIILAKGREASFLHVYHHGGIIFMCWMAMRFLITPALIGLILNSGIHSLMVWVLPVAPSTGLS